MYKQRHGERHQKERRNERLFSKLRTAHDLKLGKLNRFRSDIGSIHAVLLNCFIVKSFAEKKMKLLKLFCCCSKVG